MLIKGTKLTGTPVNDGLVTNGLQLYLDTRNPRSWTGNGTTWYDISGNNKHATFYNNPSKVQNSTGVVGDGTATNSSTFTKNASNDISFNGTSSGGVYQYAAGPNISASLSNYTISTWFNLNSFVSTTEYPCIFSLGLYTMGSPGTPAGGSVNGSLMFFNGVSGNDNKLYAGFWDGGWKYTTGYTVSTSTWYNGVMTYDGSYLSLYINGSLWNSYNTTSPSTTLVSSLGYRVGRRWDGWDSIDAYIPVAMVHNRALSTTEISQNFNYHRSRYGV